MLSKPWGRYWNSMLFMRQPHLEMEIASSNIDSKNALWVSHLLFRAHISHYVPYKKVLSSVAQQHVRVYKKSTSTKVSTSTRALGMGDEAGLCAYFSPSSGILVSLSPSSGLLWTFCISLKLYSSCWGLGSQQT